MVEDAFRPTRGDTALQFLRNFPNADPFRLDELFDGIFATPAAHSEFCVVADRVLAGTVPVGQQQHDKWLAAAYLLSPNRYEAQVDAIANQRPGIVFDLRDRSGYESHGEQQPSALTLRQLEFLARLTSTHYPEPAGLPSYGWSGDTSAWDAAEYCRKLIGAISAIPTQAASEALRCLEADTKMSSYNPHLRHALANQEIRRDC
jgi:predicted NACHT family NTPase